MKHAWLVLLVGGLLAGCAADEHEDLDNWMKQEAQDMHPKLQPLPTMSAFQVVDYDAKDIADPFNPSRLDPPKNSKGNDKDPTRDNRPRQPLEAFPLETLKMVGQMMMNGHPVALIQADKTIYQVKAGNYVGQNFGVVTKISETEVVLKELVEDSNGDWVERISTIQLQEREAKK